MKHISLFVACTAHRYLQQCIPEGVLHEVLIQRDTETYQGHSIWVSASSAATESRLFPRGSNSLCFVERIMHSIWINKLVVSAKIKSNWQLVGYCPQDGVKARISSIQSVPLVVSKQPSRKNKRWKIRGLSSVISMSLMLWLLGISFSVYLEYRPFTQTLKERLPLIVELTPTFNETDAPSMRKQLMDQPEIKEAVFVSRAEAAEVVRADLGDDIGELIGDSLYPTFTVHLNHQFVSNNQLVSIKESLENIEGVSYVFVPEVI